LIWGDAASSSYAYQQAPVPLVARGEPTDWWFAFKLNAGVFPSRDDPSRSCAFGGSVNRQGKFSQAYVFASQKSQKLAQGRGLIGTSDADPLGATFGQIYQGNYHYLVWNDDFSDHPKIHGSGTWAHAKGIVAWNDQGEGVFLQVSTPSWPGSGSRLAPRPGIAATPGHPAVAGDDNTLGCIAKPNNLMFSQHFFALKLDHRDLVLVLNALANASVITESEKDGSGRLLAPSLFNNGGPADVQDAAAKVGVRRSTSTVVTLDELSTGVRLISKPSALHAPPWQVVSATLGKVPLRAATWWGDRNIFYSTDEATVVGCWPAPLKPGSYGPVKLAVTGIWDHTPFSLMAGRPNQPNGNHAKVGVSLDPARPYVIFGDMNQQGALSGDGKTCGSAQNGRGGLFFVVSNPVLWKSVSEDLLAGDTAPVEGSPEAARWTPPLR
jgi:hypothetical protein